MNDQDILTTVGQTLHRQMPLGADRVEFTGYSYGSNTSYTILFFQGDRFLPTTPNTRLDYTGLDNAVTSLISMAGKGRFAATPFNHFRFVLAESGKMTFTTADIPRGDSWAGIHMRRISAMTEAEAAAAYIPKEDWLERVARYGAGDAV